MATPCPPPPQALAIPYFDFLYFSIVTITTVGYGDITPYTRWAKILVTLEILLGSALILIYLTLVINRAWKRS